MNQFITIIISRGNLRHFPQSTCFFCHPTLCRNNLIQNDTVCQNLTKSQQITTKKPLNHTGEKTNEHNHNKSQQFLTQGWHKQ